MNQLANAANEHELRKFLGAEVRWGMEGISKIRGVCHGCAVMVLLVLPSVAQLQIGDNLKMNLSGNVGATYDADIDQGVSAHGMGFSGNGVLTGSYYSPNFLNFNIDPSYNRSQNDNLFGNLTHTTGITSNINLFSGSHFPGSISYSRMFNDTSSYGVPGSDIGLAQHGNTNSLSVGWSAFVPNWPTLTATYSMSGNTDSIYGVEGNDRETDKVLSLSSHYSLDGWRLGGQFQHRNSNSSFDEVLESGTQPLTDQTSGSSYTATATHSLPLDGQFGATFNHLSYGYHDGTSETGGSYSVASGVSFRPVKKLGVSFNTNYTDSLLGNVPQPLLNSGTAIDLTSLGSFRSFLVGSDVYYQVYKNLGLHADISHQEQSFLGQTYSATQFGGSANFNFDRTLLKGLSFSVGVVDTAQQQSNTGVGFEGTLNYDRKFYGWDVGSNFSYAQNVQTVLLLYTTSSYSYLGSIRRRIGDRTYFAVGYSGAHSGITANSGTTTSAQRVYTTFLHRGYSLNVFWTDSNGLAVLTATGLVPVATTVPTQELSATGFTSYKSEGWGVNAGGTLFRKLSLTGAFAKSNGNTISPALTSYNDNTLINATMQYRLRKIFLIGGYTRLQQTVGTLGTSPLMVTSYYIGFSRWFNFF